MVRPLSLHRPAIRRWAGAVFAGLSLLAAPHVGAEETEPAHGIAMHGDLKYPPDFTQLDYVNPDAPVGGTLVQAATGTFDSLNPFILIGRTAAGVREYHFAQLMARSWDEPFSLYGYVARSVETPAPRDWVTFRLDERARFHDGTPITVDDVIFSMEALIAHGLPRFRNNYGRVERVERVGSDGIRFHLDAEANRETPMVLAMMPVLSRAYHAAHPVDRTTLEPPLGAGPYRIDTVDPGRSLTYARVADWWGADLPMFRGLNNFDALRFDYYRDVGVALEAFESGEYNFRRELDAERWAAQYDFPAVAAGRVTLVEAPHHRPVGLRGFVFNTRRALFNDPRVRRALVHAFDFEWINRTLLRDAYVRTDSLFANSELASSGVPDGAERDLLVGFADALPAGLMDRPYDLPVSDGRGRNRENLRVARDLLAEAGWVVDQGRLVSGETGEPFAFEILLSSAADERIALAYSDGLSRLGIDAEARTVDSAQYSARTATYDYDMMIHHWRVTLSPGTEQTLYWGSRNVDVEGSRNYAGVADPVVDALIDRLENTVDRADLVTTARALDRVLLWGDYVVPLYHDTVDRFAYWGALDWRRDADPLYGLVVESMWQAP